jgi:glycogen(starch) synthase
MAMKRIRSIQIGMEWFPEKAGGLDRYYYDLINHLPAFGVECRGLVAGSSRVVSESGGIVRAFAPANSGLWRRWFGARMEMRSLLRCFPADLVASHFALYALPLLGLISDHPFVVHFHGPWAAESAIERGELPKATADREVPSGAHGIRSRIERRVYHRADRLIVLSHAFAKVLERGYGVDAGRIRVVPGGIDTQRFATPMSRVESREVLGLPLDRPIVVAVRRLVPRMGLEELVQAAGRLKERGTDGLIFVAGKGPLHQQLADRIDNLGLKENVRLLGYVPDEHLPLLYRAADVSIVPTLALEGFGLVAVESLAAGTPALVTSVGGLPEAVSGLSTSLILPEAGIDGLADGLGAALTGKMALPSGVACQKYAADNFDWAVVGRRLREVYDEL